MGEVKRLNEAGYSFVNQSDGVTPCRLRQQAHRNLGEDRDVRPDTCGADLDAVRRPIFADPVLRGHVITPLGGL